MDTISNANHAGGIAYLQFSNQPDGRFEARYELMGLMEGLVVPSFLKDHFQLNDFTPFHDEIRNVIGRFSGGQVRDAAAARARLAGRQSVARPVPRRGRRAVRLLLHADPRDGKGTAGQHAAQAVPGRATAGRRRHDVRRENGGLVFPGRRRSRAGRDGDLTIGARIPATGDSGGRGRLACSTDG